jgi:hypothetical protein
MQPRPAELFPVCDGLQPQKLLDAPVTVESSKPTSLCTTMWQRPFVVDCHRIYVYGSAQRSASVHLALILRTSSDLPGFDLLSHSQSSTQVFREDCA